MANTYNYSGENHIKWGNTWATELRFLNVDYTLNAFWFTIKKYPDTDATDALAIVQKNVSNMDISYDITDPLNPFTKVQIYLLEDDTKQTPGIYQYDIKMSSASDDITIQSGCFEIRSVVTGRSV